MLQALEKLPPPQLSLSAAALALAVSERHLSRLFARHLGTSFARYAQRRRIVESCRLLALTQPERLPIAEVARRVGFGDVKYFARLFKRETGVSPSDYRRRSAAERAP